MIWPFRPTCALCQLEPTSSPSVLCQPCQQDLPLRRHLAQMHADPDDWLDQGQLPIWIASDYVYPISELITQFKNQSQLHWDTVLAELIQLRLPYPAALTPAPKALITLPSSASRLRERGFDPMGLIGQRLARHWKLPVSQALIRIDQQTVRQQGLSRHERVGRQLAFKLVAPVPDTVLLLDDVVTTGTTLMQAAAVLRQAGCTVYGVAIASNRRQKAVVQYDLI